MGDGLKRATAAARATQATEDGKELLRLIAAHANGAERYRMPLATTKNDRIRQRCRKAGWIYYQSGRWFITPEGRAVIA